MLDLLRQRDPRLAGELRDPHDRGEYRCRAVPLILGHAAKGETVIITRRGAPVAQIVPYGRPPADEARHPAWNRLLGTLEEGVRLGGTPFDRDSRYDR